MAYDEISTRRTPMLRTLRTYRSQFSQSGDGPEGFRFTDENVEKIISDAGREEVFARARALGWGQKETPPRWVWVQIAYELIRHRDTIGRSSPQE